MCICELKLILKYLFLVFLRMARVGFLSVSLSALGIVDRLQSRVQRALLSDSFGNRAP